MDKLRNQRIAGVILAGGNSRRLSGIAKGAIELDSGDCIIERLIKELAAAGVGDFITASVISGTLLQIILSFPIAFIPVIVANKSKPIEVRIVKIFSELRLKVIFRPIIRYREITESKFI